MSVDKLVNFINDGLIEVCKLIKEGTKLHLVFTGKMVYFVGYLLLSWCIILYIGTELCWYLLVSWIMCVQPFVLQVSTGKVGVCG